MKKKVEEEKSSRGGQIRYKPGKVHPEETRRRRQLIKKIVNERGFKSVIELKKILEEEFNLYIGCRATLYNDIKAIGGISATDYDAISTRIIASAQAHLNQLNDICHASKDNPKLYISATRAYFQSVKDLQDLLSRVTIRDARKAVYDKQSGRKADRFVIRFDDSVEVVDGGSDGEKSESGEEGSKKG